MEDSVAYQFTNIVSLYQNLDKTGTRGRQVISDVHEVLKLELAPGMLLYRITAVLVGISSQSIARRSFHKLLACVQI
jgi:chromosome condensin MukBEF complex kleisin-like MukF subunit